MSNLLELATISCPYCGESIDLTVDYSISPMEYIEDCSVCCQPITIKTQFSEADGGSIIAMHQDDC